MLGEESAKKFLLGEKSARRFLLEECTQDRIGWGREAKKSSVVSDGLGVRLDFRLLSYGCLPEYIK